MKTLPKSIRKFVERQPRMERDKLYQADPDAVYGSYWYRGIAAIVLADRVAGKYDGLPNKTDVNRVCKEANFNQYLFDRIARFLVEAKVVEVGRNKQFGPGPHLDAFWNCDMSQLATHAGEAVRNIVEKEAKLKVGQFGSAKPPQLLSFLKLFFSCFEDWALPEKEFGKILLEFAQLPPDELARLDPANASLTPLWSRCAKWLDERGQNAIRSALYTTEWLYFAEDKKKDWVFLSALGAGSLGLGKLPAPPKLLTDLTVQSDLTVFAGAGLPLEKLIPLFRSCRIRRIGQLFEFELDRKRLAQSPKSASVQSELRAVFDNQKSLPPSVVDLLKTKSKIGGKVRIRWCNALIQPESDEVLEMIRKHPKLKGYIEAGAPPGYLLIKPQSNPNNFVLRCQELGFAVKPL